MREEGDGFPDDLVGDVTGDVTGTVGCSGKKTGMGDAGLEEDEWEGKPPPLPPLPTSHALPPSSPLPSPTSSTSYPCPTRAVGRGEKGKGVGGNGDRRTRLAPGELTGFSPRIDRIFSTETSKLYLKG